MSKQDILDEIFEDFDFEKVEKVMIFLDWKWASYHYESNRVPTIEKMKEHVVNLFNSYYENVVGELTEHSGITSGGFTLRYQQGKYILDFVVETSRWGNHK